MFHSSNFLKILCKITSPVTKPHLSPFSQTTVTLKPWVHGWEAVNLDKCSLTKCEILIITRNFAKATWAQDSWTTPVRALTHLQLPVKHSRALFPREEGKGAGMKERSLAWCDTLLAAWLWFQLLQSPRHDCITCYDSGCYSSQTFGSTQAN